MTSQKNIVILISGGGSNMAAIVRAAQREHWLRRGLFAPAFLSLSLTRLARVALGKGKAGAADTNLPVGW